MGWSGREAELRNALAGDPCGPVRRKAGDSAFRPIAAGATIELQQFYALRGIATDEEDWVFQTKDGKPRMKDFEVSWKSFLEWAEEKTGRISLRFDANGRRFDPYSLRHYYATERLLEHVTWEELAINMGHKDVYMLMKFYAHVRTDAFITRVNAFRRKRKRLEVRLEDVLKPDDGEGT